MLLFISVGKKALGMISKQKGFSLIEVLISFLLLGIGALGLTKLQIYMERESDYAIQSIRHCDWPKSTSCSASRCF